MKHGTLHAVLIALACIASAAKAAEEYPCAGTVRIVVGFGAGAATDVQSRIIADRLGKRVGRTVIVENKSGADGAIAANYAIDQPPDGCTLMTPTNGLFGVAPMSAGRIAMPNLEEFVPISMMARNTQFFVVNGTSPLKTLADFIAFAKAQPKGKPLTYGTGNTSGYVSGALFEALSGVDFIRVPYKGESKVSTDLMGGQITAGFVLNALPQITSGKLRALAVLDDRRFDGLPDVPAITELYPEFRDIGLISPHGTLAGPRGFPKKTAEWLSREVNEILREPDVQALFQNIGSKAQGSTPAELADYYRQEAREWPRIVKEYRLETPAR